MTLDMAKVRETRDLLGAETFCKFLQRFEDEMDTFIGWLSAAPAPVSEDIGRWCHNLASSAGLYGAKDLRPALLTAEKVAKAGDPVALSAVTVTLSILWTEQQCDLRGLV